jgi:hypothetical protein
VVDGFVFIRDSSLRDSEESRYNFGIRDKRTFRAYEDYLCAALKGKEEAVAYL